MLDAMAGFDPADSTSLDEPPPDLTASLNEPLESLTIGVPDNFFDEGLDPANAEAVRQALSELEKLGARLKSISLANIHLSVPTYYVVAPAEASSNLSRYDGIRFGHRSESAVEADLVEFYKRNRGEGFGAEVQRRILTGTYVLSAGYFDAYYLKAQKARQLISRDFSEAFADVGRDCRADNADSRVRHRPEDGRPGRDVPQRHLHDRGEPGRAARALDSLRLRR